MQMGNTADFAENAIPLPAAIIRLPAHTADDLRAIVRGEQPVEKNLAARLRANAPRSMPVTCADVAEGICNLKHDHAALSEWASFILVAAHAFQIDDQHTGYWDRLQMCVWQLAFGQPLHDASLSLADAVRSRPSFV